MSDNNPSEVDPFGQIADEFVEAIRQGQRPSIEEFAQRYPEHADDIRDMLPALLLMEQAKTSDDSPEQPRPAQGSAATLSLKQLGDYQILREVGRGGMGVVYEAQQLSLGRHVAIKVLPAPALLDARQLGRFQREARSAAKLHHTNIVPVYGVGEQDGLHYYVMQFIQGLGLDVVLRELRRLRQPRGKQAPTQGDAPGRPTNLARDASAVAVAHGLLTGEYRASEPDPALTNAPGEAPSSSSAHVADTSATIHLPGQSGGSSLSDSGTQYWQSVARVGMQVADALAHAASQGVLHRDIKPSNLLLDDTGNVWVTDFGLAKAVSDSDNLTHTGDIVGTLRYMAPERFDGQGDLRSDTYSLGLTLYEMLVLRPAFNEAERNKLIKEVMHGEPAPPRKLNPSVPRDLETVVLKAIARERVQRYQTPTEMAEDLKRFIEDRPVRARRITTAEQFWRWCRRNPLPASLLAGILFVFLIGFAGVLWQWREAEQSQKETANALTVVAAQKTAVESSLDKAEKAEHVARSAEEAGRRLLYTTDMQLAPFVWKDDRTTAEQLRLLLANHVPDRNAAVAKPDLRGFEWYYNRHLLEHSAAVLSGHGVAVVDGAFTDDGHVVTLDEKDQVRRWNLGTPDEDEKSRRDLPGGASAQVRVLSPDGRLAALAVGNKVHVVDTSTGKETLAIDSANEKGRLLTFSRDGNRLVIVDDKIRWYNSLTGEAIASFDQKFERPRHLGLSADGLTLAVVGYGGNNGEASIYRLDAAAKRFALLKEFRMGTISGSALSPDGKRLVLSSWFGGDLFVHDIATGRMIARIGAAHACRISAIAFSDDGTRLASADEQGTIRIWADAPNLTSKSTALRTLKGHQGSINSVRFSRDGKRLFSSGWKRAWEDMGAMDKTARVWDLENAATAFRPLERSRGSGVARLSPDGLLIADADDRGVHLWDAATGQLVRDLPAAGIGRVHSLAFSPTDSRLLAVGAEAGPDDSHVALWDLDAGKELARLSGATDLPGFWIRDGSGTVGALAFSPDGKYLVAGFGGRIGYPNPLRNTPFPLKVWEVATRLPIHRLVGHSWCCSSIDFSRDGKLLASGSYDGKAIIWSTNTWEALQTLQPPYVVFVHSTAFSPDGKTLAVGDDRGNIQWWDVATGRLLETVTGHAASVRSLVYSPDGRTLASGSEDLTVRLWNVATRRQLMQLDRGSIDLGFVQTLVFSPDGKQLLAGGTESSGVWSAAPILWNDPDRAAEKLHRMLLSNADRVGRASQPVRDGLGSPSYFQSRIRMFSENPRLHEALSKLDANDVRVQAALAAAQANWHGARRDWPEAVAAFDRLLAADASSPEAWLRTPGLLRLATALLHQDRPAAAARMFQGWAERRRQDGLPAIMRSDRAIGELLPALEKRLAENSRDAGLLELRAELAGQWSDGKAQVADYTAAIKILAEQPAEAASAHLRRLYRRRGDVYMSLKRWQEATDDYARIVTDKTKDEALLSNQALARANAYLEQESAATWTVLKPAEMNSEGGATLTLLEDGSVLASGPNPVRDSYTLVCPTSLPKIAAVRLEALPDPSLPHNGPGRAKENGNVALSEWKVTAEPQKPGETPRVIRWKDAWSDHRLKAAEHYNKRPMHIGLAIDGDWKTYWETWPKSGSPHLAIFLPDEPIGPGKGGKLKFSLDFRTGYTGNNLGRFRLSISANPTALAREQQHFTAMKLTDPWQKLAAVYQLQGDHQALDHLIQRRPKLASTIGDLYAAAQDWERAIAEYRKLITEQSPDVALLNKLATAYQSAGRTREAVPYLAKVSAANPTDTGLSLQVAALQAWFGEDKELAATCGRGLELAKNTTVPETADRVAKACCVLPSTDKAQCEAVLVLARKAVQLGKDSPFLPYFEMALGMAEYRSGNFAAAAKTLLAAAATGPNDGHVRGTVAFYRAMSLFRQGNEAEARKLATEAAAKMIPLPADEKNPLAGGKNADDLILWLAYKEAKALIPFDAAPPPKAKPKQK